MDSKPKSANKRVSSVNIVEQCESSRTSYRIPITSSRTWVCVIHRLRQILRIKVHWHVAQHVPSDCAAFRQAVERTTANIWERWLGRELQSRTHVKTHFACTASPAIKS